MEKDEIIRKLERENEELREKLSESTAIVDSIRSGAVDALVVTDPEGRPQVFAIESADYTYRILIEKFTEGALSIAKNGLILYANSYFAALVGKNQTEIPGTNLHDYFKDASDLDNLLTESKDGQAKRESLLQTEERTISVNVGLTDLHPTVPAIGVVITDLTQEKFQERELLNYQQQLKDNIAELYTTNSNLEQVIHVISHDLKEPLRKILTYISQLNNHGNGGLSEKETNWLNIVNASAFRLNSLLDDVVKFAFVNEHTTPDSVDLNLVVQEVLEDLEVSVAENSFTVNFPQLPTIKSSYVQMRQLFANIFSNAMKYRKQETPKVAIELDDSDLAKPYFSITIIDNGIGMRSENISQIFTVFKRLHHKNEYSGNGIGLAICKKIMDNHSGRIEASSELGLGSSFSLYFPKHLIVE
ncbi:ATP-binding protein [Flavobacterium sp.]|uniref:sensor histidine kinase n=1 Tax=Flavobacterium sp. TaxID=239 RepID=UPI00121EDBB4|nr:ATP-binding protein [Flavobacterium sp.]RZJ69266.1 MAG: PAS domain-containing protein [Flavobacterium sp.]